MKQRAEHNLRSLADKDEGAATSIQALLPPSVVQAANQNPTASGSTPRLSRPASPNHSQTPAADEDAAGESDDAGATDPNQSFRSFRDGRTTSRQNSRAPDTQVSELGTARCEYLFSLVGRLLRHFVSPPKCQSRKCRRRKFPRKRNRRYNHQQSERLPSQGKVHSLSGHE
jgi:hypothetical protein